MPEIPEKSSSLEDQNTNLPSPGNQGQSQGESQAKSRVTSHFEQFIGMMQRSAGHDPIVEKLTPEHIDKLIGLSEGQSARSHDEKKFNVTVLAGVTITGIIGVIALCWLFLYYQKSDQAALVISHMVALVGGLGGGFGIGRASKKD